MTDEALRSLLRDPSCSGASRIGLLARKPFWDEDALPFKLHGYGSVLRLVPSPGFTRDNLAATADERAVLADCPDDEGWLVPRDVLSFWLDRHVKCAELDDLLLAHPLYSYLTQVDDKGHSRIGKTPLAFWDPGVATAASVMAPPFLPDDREAPAINRDRAVYADAVVDLLHELREAFDLLEVEVGATFA